MRRIPLLASAALGVALGGPISVVWAQQPAQDPRSPVAVTATQKAFILGQMRRFVVAIQQIDEGLAEKDKAKAVAAARSRGMKAMRAMTDKPKGLEDAMSPEWKRRGVDTHMGFDAIADAVEQNKSTDEILGMLGATTKNCVACHQSYRLVAPDPTAH
ncbi:hypothetical protein K9U39_13745 [Rhodoblastus acidophilus]|uniref:Cytochrome C n=1 Tax=Candidatus Rhodoblastus alkanivorans TaxID=2954117 RepID=A0ABS9ZAV4_9HYPH|nr:hypothetical protein [Candidatus Rhodoblastus alkanivorans]MCI4677831.1 hypothetical protein [Candidatus Rhodoblastus alkanivorans]MCI4684671.1 hypothetical protein [Candidatus Rhodoblastus alkanivorans]MDI4641993.1 hypothetical protein [Rhodoblastus acidophilus]